jgi:hypothetical protein
LKENPFTKKEKPYGSCSCLLGEIFGRGSRKCLSGFLIFLANGEDHTIEKYFFNHKKPNGQISAFRCRILFTPHLSHYYLTGQISVVCFCLIVLNLRLVYLLKCFIFTMASYGYFLSFILKFVKKSFKCGVLPSDYLLCSWFHLKMFPIRAAAPVLRRGPAGGAIGRRVRLEL